MSAKRELSSTLKNLKVRIPLPALSRFIPRQGCESHGCSLSVAAAAAQFMQRAVSAQKVQEKTEVEVETAAEVVTATDGGFGSPAQIRRKWYID